jgi:hypothetical protein
MTPIGVLNFPTFFEAKGNKSNPSQDPRFSGMLLFDEDALATTAYQQVREAILEAITEKWGQAKAADKNFVNTLRMPLRNASEKTYAGFENGEKFMSAWSRGSDPAPGVVDLNGTTIVVPGDVFSGQLARFTVRAFAYDSNGNKGVAFGLEHIQIVKADMERLDGRQKAEDAFKDNSNGSDEQLAALGITPGAPGTSAGSNTPPADANLPF